MSQDPVEDLRQEIEKGHVLVVVGSGVSLGATNGNPLASWTGLLKDGVERCVKVKGLDAKWANRVKEEIDSGDMDDLLSAAEKISSKLGFPDGGEYRRWLRETVGGLRVQDRSVLEALRDLDLPLATTNYDGLLEDVTKLDPVTWRDGDQVARAIRGEEPGVIHLHGHWKQPESVILGLRSYEKILNHGHAQAVLRAVQTLHTLLFVGCGDGLRDPNFEALLKWAREVFKESEVRHYRLCLNGEVEDLRKQHKDDRLHPLPYGPEHANLAEFLRALKAPAAVSDTPNGAKASSIFISYNHRDRGFVRRLVFDLKRLGVEVWIDEVEGRIGESLIDTVQTGISTAGYLGVVLSPNSVASAWVQREIEAALTEEIATGRIKVLPLLIQDCQIPPFLAGRIYADFRNDDSYSTALGKLAERLGVHALQPKSLVLKDAEAAIRHFAATHGLRNGAITEASPSSFGTTAFKMRLSGFKGVVYYHASGPLSGRVFYARAGIGLCYEYKLGGSGSRLGLPTSHEESRDTKGNRISYFEGGYIEWFKEGSIARAVETVTSGEVSRDEAIERTGIDWVELAEQQHAAMIEDLAWAKGD